MKKTLFILIIQAFSIAGITAQETEGVVFAQHHMDYGIIAKGADPVKKFKFVNKGKTPVFITEAKGSCGCTVANFPKEVIAPGDSGEVEVRYDTNRTGKFNKIVTVTTSQGTKHTLTIDGEVKDKEG